MAGHETVLKYGINEFFMKTDISLEHHYLKQRILKESSYALYINFWLEFFPPEQVW